MIQKRTTLIIALMSSVLSLSGIQAAEKPNIILMVADDMGWGEIGTYGGSRNLTPHLSNLSDSGIRFNQFYSAGSVCTPTRVSILTGRYPHRFGLFNSIFKDKGGNLGTNATTIAEILQDAGYTTAHMGKWHLGGVRGIDIKERLEKNPQADPGPHEHGFDHYQVQIEDAGERRQLVRTKQLYRQGGTILARNEKRVPKSDPYYGKHWEDCSGDYALEMIDQFHDDEKPFFLNIWWYTPHTPIEPSPEPYFTRAEEDPLTETRASKSSSDQAEYSSMITHMDDRVGMIVERLKKLGIYENTIIVFTSDNGAAWGGFNGELSIGKASYYEGGIRVPSLISWPGKIKPKSTTDYIGHSNDLLPTLCAMAGVEIPNKEEIDGMNLMSVLRGESDVPERDTLFWLSPRGGKGQRIKTAPLVVANVVREGKWKLCFSPEKEPIALFDIDADAQESNNIIKKPKYAKLVERLTKKLIDHYAEPYIKKEQPDGKPIHVLAAE